MSKDREGYRVKDSMTMILKIWKDPVWSKVIATGIITGIAALSLYWYYGWLIIKDAIMLVYHLILSTTAIPNWLLGILIIPTLLFTYVILILLKEKLTDTNISQDSYKNYVSDDFFGLNWVWSYSTNGSISNLHSLCPHCNYQIIAKDISNYHVIPRLGFVCDECGYKAEAFQGYYVELEQKIRLKIQKNLRTNEWKIK